VPVLAVPGDATLLPTRAIVAIDFSPSSVDAAMLAATMLGANGTVQLLHASAFAMDDAKPDSLLSTYTAGAAEKLEVIAERVRRRTKRHVSYVVARGDIGEQLMERAAADNCDLIALGSHEPSVLDRLLGGSVRAEVLRSAGCSVLIAPAPVPVTPEEE
jgi:nucleotide-binding universal stress UspA family protein